MAAESILIVDDEETILTSMGMALSGAGFTVHCARSGAQARDALETSSPFALAVLDYRLPDCTGLDLLRLIKKRTPSTRAIVMTAYSTVELAVNAMKLGADEFAIKPVPAEAIVQMIRGLTYVEPESEPAASSTRRRTRTIEFLGDSPATRRLRGLITRVAQSPAPTVLVTGESGTGKDLVASMLHASSSRAERPFTNITCSALPENLLESELFGHEAGAFTSAARAKQGLLELSDGGTVFLDEVAEMTPALQAKLLRFLEERAFRRVGGTKDIRVDVRVIAATNRDLSAAMQSGAFRPDLYYRLCVVPLRLASLRERREDISVLAKHFVQGYSETFGKKVDGIAPEALALLERYAWPGNVRELKHTMERAVLLCDGQQIRAAEIEFAESRSGEFVFRLPPNGVMLEQVERSLLVQALEATRWNQVRAGRLLGLNRDQVRYRIEKFSLERKNVTTAA